MTLAPGRQPHVDHPDYPSGVVVEIARIAVQPGLEDQFLAAYPEAHQILAGSPGFLSGRITRGVESPSLFVLIIERESVEAHLKNFAETERFTRFAALLMPFLAGQPEVGHFVDVPTVAD